MKLDKRIKSKSDILSCFDIENAKEFVFVDQKGYFANEISSFCDINICKYGTLGSVLGDQQESFYNPHKSPHLYGVGIKAIKNKNA